MEYIINSQKEGIDFERYAAYLDSIRNRLPAHVGAFASDSRHFDLSSHSSLHDAWLESLTVSEAATGQRSEIRRLEIHLCLLGPFHDRRIHLRYSGVTRYRFDLSAQEGEQVAQGDLFTHEIRVNDAGALIHEILFQNATLLIECRDMRHSEEMIEAEQ
ncbi:MAG: hypothetical protein JWM68_5177 [Verrucomicrobiales bacterium]|nr:hypothetical protein [Verrucomicrobiales bacterium]